MAHRILVLRPAIRPMHRILITGPLGKSCKDFNKDDYKNYWTALRIHGKVWNHKFLGIKACALLRFYQVTLDLLKWSRSLWDPQGTNPFPFSYFLFVGNRLRSDSLTFPKFQRTDSNSCLLGKGRNIETQEEQSRNNSAAMGQGPVSSSRDTYIYLWVLLQGFPYDLAGKESICNAGDLGSIPGLGRSPGEGKGYLLQYSDLQNSMDYIVHGVVKSRTWLSNFHNSNKQELRSPPR